MRKNKWLLVLFMTLIVVVSCKPPKIDNIRCELPKLNTPIAPSENLKVAIYVDGTPSMEGYVSTNTKSRYTQTLELLDRTFYLTSSKVAYQRLGTSIQQLSREQYKQDAQSPNFYNGKTPQYPPLSVSQIEKAIALQPQDNQLVIIATDLYQKNADITKVSKEIKNNYLNVEQKAKGYSVGIIAVKSEFNGTVYTEDTATPKIPHCMPMNIEAIKIPVNIRLQRTLIQALSKDCSSKAAAFSKGRGIAERQISTNIGTAILHFSPNTIGT